VIVKYLVEPNTVTHYKQETFLEPGVYYRYLGTKPNDETKRRLCLRACNKGREFLWLTVYEPWVKSFVDGQFITRPSVDLPPDWFLVGVDPKLVRGWQQRLVREAWNYLRSGLDYRKGWIAPLGAGKTLAGLLVMNLYERGEAAVLASRYLHETWKSQAAEWGLPEPLISTYESCHKLPESIRCLIVDEAVAFKNADAQRTIKAVEVSQRCDTVIGFTGIPTAGGGPSDFRWLRVVEPGCLPGELKAWQFKWGLDTKVQEVGPNKAYVTTEWDTKAVAKFISPYINTVDISEIASEMPEVTFTTITCAQPQQYEQIRAGAATTSGVHKRLAQVLQCTDGFIYNDDARPVRIVSDKLRVVEEWVKNLGEPVILVSAWTEAIEQLAEIFRDEWPAVLTGSTADPSNEIARFKSGHTRVLIADAGFSKGMNLQKVCRVIGFLSVSSKPDDYRQMLGRVARPGQKDGVQIVHFQCENTLDARRLELVQKHGECSEQFIDKLLEEELLKW
jgi:hypothetical protein